MIQKLAAIFGADGSLARCIPNYDPRESQLRMAQAIGAALTDGRGTDGFEICGRLVVEAETGIGKTLAYLIPAVLSGRRVVISTATLTLQDQIIDKDLPLIEKVLDQPVSYLCLKGRQNYLCLYKWHQYRSDPQLSLFDKPWVQKLDAWVTATQTGDKAELAWLDENSPLWPRLSAHSGQCLGGDCPEWAECYVNAARKLAGSVQLLVVNHHLFFSDLALKQKKYGDLFPRYEAVIFDEAHHIENVATTFFGKSFSHFQLLDLLQEIEKKAPEDLDEHIVDSLLPRLTSMRQRAEHFSNLLPGKSGRFPLHELVAELTEAFWRDEVDLLCLGLDKLLEKISPYGEWSDIWRSFCKRGKDLRETIQEIAFGEDGTNGCVYWYEKKERTAVISATPIEVATLLQDHLFQEVEACIMTSATLSSGGSFDYIAERLGLGESFQYLQFASPFDYEQRTLIYIPEKNFPDPGAPEFLADAAGRILEILELSHGRALVLCTSLRSMKIYAEYLEEKISYPVFVQGMGSRSTLLQKFRDETNSVLLAVASFWEGVDIVGESLSCVIIDKLPFEVPTDPVIQARIRQIKEQGENAFFTFQIPRAVLSLKQGAGRLMRSPTDAGVIAILDVRLYSKGYGSAFRRSLPASPISRRLADVEAFFGNLPEISGEDVKTS